MKIFKLIGWSSALCLSAMTVQAQETNEIVQLKKQMHEMQESFEKITRSQQQQIEALTKKLDEFTKSSANPAVVPPKTDEQKKLESELAAELAKDTATNGVSTKTSVDTELSKPWSASQPITIARSGSAYMNLSFDALMDAGWSTVSDPSDQLELGDHDPLKRGFSLRNTELALDGAVDPYFKGFANIVLKLDKDNETEIELEETYLQSTSLPGNLQLKAGQFFAAFGRQNPQHPHQWAFVDAQLFRRESWGRKRCGIPALKFPGSRRRHFTPKCFSEFSTGRAARRTVSEIQARTTARV